MKAERKTDELSYGYRREIDATFEDTVDRIKLALLDEGFGVLTEIDIKKKLNEKLGVEFRNYLILGACNPPIAHSALQEDLDIGLLLPCNVIVYERGDKIAVAAIDARKMLSVTKNSSLDAAAEMINEKLRLAVDSI